MQIQLKLIGELSIAGDLLRAIDGTRLRHVGQTDGTRLGVVHTVNRRDLHVRAHQRRVWFATFPRNTHHPRATGVELNRSIFVVQDMGALVTVNRTPGRA